MYTICISCDAQSTDNIHAVKSMVGADHRSCPSSGCCRGESQQGLTWSRADEANHKLCWNYLTPNFFSSLKMVSPSPGLLAGILGAVNVWVSVCNRCINKTQQRNCYRVATVDRILWYRCWMGRDIISWWWFQLFFIFTPTWRNNLIWLYNIFQMGWNHQLCSHFIKNHLHENRFGRWTIFL